MGHLVGGGDGMTYVAIAYRYGWSNGHWYIVHAGSNMRAIVDAAQAENASRGGKYGVQVVEIDDQGNEKEIKYFPSSHNEDHPRLCVRREVWEKIGCRVLEAIDKGEPLTVNEIKASTEHETAIQQIMAGGGTP